MEIKSLDARYDYDSRVDVVNIEVKKSMYMRYHLTWKLVFSFILIRIIFR